MAKLNEDVKVVMLKGEKGETGEAGQGIPSGGKKGQAIIKASDNDYDYKWGSLVVNDVANATNDGNGNNIVNTYATKTDVSTNYLTKTDASNTYATKTESGNAVNFDKIYPVGSIYMNLKNVEPSTLFGGTWEQILGKFLLAAYDGGGYPSGSTGGEAEHTLTIQEMPNHTHSLTLVADGIGGNSGRGVVYDYKNGSTIATTDPTGNNIPHNNMPPYLAVYMWKRTA